LLEPAVTNGECLNPLKTCEAVKLQHSNLFTSQQPTETTGLTSNDQNAVERHTHQLHYCHNRLAYWVPHISYITERHTHQLHYCHNRL